MNQTDLGSSRGAITRPTDTNSYAAGDSIADSTSAPTMLTFHHIGKNGMGRLQQAILVDSANVVAAKLDGELWLFSVAPTAINDNAAFAPTDAELLNLVAVIAFTQGTFLVAAATSGAGGNAVNVQGGMDIPFKCKPGSNDLYGMLVARNAYAPVSGEIFTVTLVASYQR